jgi:uncharacterized protein (DUF433 family)
VSDHRQYIAVDPGIRFGKPCVKGTRIAVGDVLGWLASGMSIEHICAEYPQLRSEHVLAALAYAAEFMDGDWKMSA